MMQCEEGERERELQQPCGAKGVRRGTHNVCEDVQDRGQTDTQDVTEYATHVVAVQPTSLHGQSGPMDWEAGN